MVWRAPSFDADAWECAPVSLLAVPASSGCSRAIVGDVDPSELLPESNGGPTQAHLVDRVLAQVRVGSVGSRHLGGHHTFEALPRSSTGSSRAGTLTTVSDLLDH
jgi:hypothetical protein